MSRRRPLVLEDTESPVAVSGTWVLYDIAFFVWMYFPISGPDGTISHKTSGIEIGQKGFKDGMREFSIDPRDIEVRRRHLGIMLCS